MKKSLHVIAAIFTLSALAFGCGSDQATLQGITRESPLTVGSASLPEEFGNGTQPSDFTFSAQEGELLVVFFGYTMCPDICPTSLSDFRSALRRLGDRADKVDLAFVTVDPERDTADKLIPFLSTYAIRSSVTTDENGYVQVTHTGTAFVVDSNGVVVVELPFGIGADGMENDFRVLFNNIENGEQ
jgi:protein SCO1/2